MFVFVSEFPIRFSSGCDPFSNSSTKADSIYIIHIFFCHDAVNVRKFREKKQQTLKFAVFFLVLFVMCRYRKVKNSFSIRNRFYFRFNGFSLPTPRFAFVVIVEFFFARRFLSSIITYPCLVATIAFNCIRCDSQFGSI